MGQWENLPADVLNVIEKRFISYADKVRFTFICKSWKSSLPRTPNTFRELQLPWLLVPCNDTCSQSSYGLFNVLDMKTYSLDLLKFERVLFRGSSHGWVVNIEGPENEIYLMNPLTRAKIQLPSRSKFPDVKEYCVDNIGDEYTLWHSNDITYTLDSRHIRIYLTPKFILSSDPNLTDDYVVVAIYGEFCRLAYCKHGYEKWISIPISGVSDVQFIDGKIHAVIKNGSLEVIDIHPHPQAENKAEPFNPLPSNSVLYIVESSKQLLLVQRIFNVTVSTNQRDIFVYKTGCFNIFKLDLTCSRWCRLTDIGDDVLFVGFSTSESRSSVEFPGLKRNSIYFTDDLFCSHYEGIQGGTEMGVFDLNTRKIEPLPGYKCESDLVWPPPIWVIPTP